MAARRIAMLAGHLAPPLPIPQGLTSSVVSSSSSGRRFEGKACVVTGGASGVGKATANLLASEGARVLIVDIDGQAAEEAVKELSEAHGDGRILPFTADVGSEEDAQAIVAACLKHFGSLDVYFSNAGVLPPWCELKDSTLSSFERTLRVNLVGQFLAIKYASAAMQTAGNGGAIVCTASIAAIRADIAAVEYSASKAGILGLVHAAQDFLLKDGIRVNAVAPGGVNTPLMYKVPMQLAQQGLEVVNYDMERFPPSEPEEIASVVAFLSSDEALAIKGQCIVCDKGLTNSLGMKIQEKRKRKKKAP